ncbi:nucleotidyltransferase domain-containing protein [Streptomyces sp. NPDC088183]|uniref:nucleotidyltransferase domain-containing protein n=1 Tax=Streptomyces sp. NPDC088183 TaxID=3160992 RepID=UPI003437C59E
MMDMRSLITLLRETASSEFLDSFWFVYLFGSARGGLRADSDVDLIFVYECGREEMARRFRLNACRRAWDAYGVQLDITLLNKEEEEDIGFVARERAVLILGSSEPLTR